MSLWWVRPPCCPSLAFLVQYQKLLDLFGNTSGAEHKCSPGPFVCLCYPFATLSSNCVDHNIAPMPNQHKPPRMLLLDNNIHCSMQTSISSTQ